MSGPKSSSGIKGVSYWPKKNPTYPYFVRYKAIMYGTFPTLESAETYLELVKDALDGKGEMPEPVIKYRRTHGLNVVQKRKPRKKKAVKKKPKKPDPMNRCCITCKWRSGMDSTKSASGTNLYCKYGLQDGNHTRLYLHYKRTGTTDLSTFTHDKNCTEWEPRAQTK